jgi:hypothetical protein
MSKDDTMALEKAQRTITTARAVMRVTYLAHFAETHSEDWLKLQTMLSEADRRYTSTFYRIKLHKFACEVCKALRVGLEALEQIELPVPEPEADGDG